MRLHVLSDLHLEFSAFRVPPTRADVVVLAGDIASGVKGLRWSLKTFSVPVVYILGNHEFYGNDLDLVHEIKREAMGTHIHVLERDDVVLDGVRFLGCTLWTDFGLFGVGRRDQIMEQADAVIRDFRVISKHGKAFTAPRSLAEHSASRQWLGRQLDDSGVALPTVVVTHHAPHPGSLAHRFRDDPLSAAFVSNLGELMGRPNLWIHGHTHSSFDYTVAGTRILCNARGYPLPAGSTEIENPRFDPALVVDVSAIR